MLMYVRALLCTVYVWDVVDARGQCLRVLCMVSQQTREWHNSSSSVASVLLLRSVLAGNWVVSELSTLTGSMRIRPTSTTRSSWLTQHTMLCVMTRESTGSATQFTSTVSSEDLPQRERRTEVSAERVTTTTRTVHLAGLHGRKTTLSAFVVTVDCLLLLLLLLSSSRFHVVALLSLSGWLVFANFGDYTIMLWT